MAAVKLLKGDRLYLMDLQNKRCEISNYHFVRIRDFLSANEFNEAGNLDNADAVLVNACAGVDEIVDLGEMFIEKVVKTINNKPFFNIGCLSTISKNHTKTESVIPIGPNKIREIENYFEHTIPFSEIKPERDIVGEDYQLGIEKDDKFVLISQGCANACSYCNKKRVKGNVNSRQEQDIIEDVKQLIDKGYYVITLLSDDCGSYGIDRQTNIGDLVNRLLSLDDRLMIKIYYIHPSKFLDNYENLRNAIYEKRIKYIGIPIQSGSPRILGLMNRNYDLKLLESYLRDIKRVNPEIHLYSHFIFNFPTETMVEFEESLSYSKLFDYSLIIGFCDNNHVKSHSITPKCTKKEYEKKLTIINEKSRSGEINGAFGTAAELHTADMIDRVRRRNLKVDDNLPKKKDNTLTIHGPEDVLDQIGIKIPDHA